MRVLLSLLFLVIHVFAYGQGNGKVDSLSFLFMGDIMGHSPQIKAAYDAKNGSYNFSKVFNKVSPIIKKVDIAVANLEVTLAGEPYTGYPQFSSPKELAVACKQSGIDVLVTANNHSCDRGESGILKTIDVLNSIKIHHTGTFRDSTDWKNDNLLVFDKNNIRVGLLNYTYGTNGLRVPKPTVVNLIDTLKMLSDIEKSRGDSLDQLIVVLHWGKEYESQPSESQVRITDFLFRNGVDIIVGSHPHVLQKMEYFPKQNGSNGYNLIAYSLGNFVSNQRKRKRDGGAMLRFTLTKGDAGIAISNLGYYLTWVYKHYPGGKLAYEILPCAKMESEDTEYLDPNSTEKMKLFISDSRALLNRENLDVVEFDSNRK